MIRSNSIDLLSYQLDGDDMQVIPDQQLDVARTNWAIAQAHWGIFPTLRSPLPTSTLEVLSLVFSIRPRRVDKQGRTRRPLGRWKVLGVEVRHHPDAYLKHRLEKKHWGIQPRYYPLLGFGALASARRFWQAFDEVCSHIRWRQPPSEAVGLRQGQSEFLTRREGLHRQFLAR